MAGDDAQSSSPVSSPQSNPDTIAVAAAQPKPRFLRPGDVLLNNNSSPQIVAKDVVANAKHSATSHDQQPAPKRQRKAPAKKDADNKGDEKPVKEKKPRKTRAVDPNKPAAASRKKQKTGDAPPAPAPRSVPATHQPTIVEMVNQFAGSVPPPAETPKQQLHPAQIMREDLTSSIAHPISRPASSGQRYDPIRSSMTSDPYTSSYNGASHPPPVPQASPYRASASPSISSLMNPSTSYPAMSSPSTQQSMQAPPKRQVIPTAQSPTITKASVKPSVVVSNIEASSTPPKAPPAEPVILPDDSKKTEDSLPKIQEVKEKEKEKEKEKAPAKPSSTTAKAKKASPPPTRPTGSGLLSGSDLFGGPAMGENDRTRHGVDIDIRIVLDPQGNNTVNIAQEIMKKYGRDAINPRAAAHRERLLQVANMGARLENGSADDMSVDLNSDLENDSNVEMGGMDDEKKDETEDGKPKRRRRKKIEEYDKDDDFIDDTELAWQEGAAVAKDGFFVYSGPLIPAGEEAKIESSSGPSGRGRGRGRGRTRAAANTASGVTHAQIAAKNETVAPTAAAATAAASATAAAATSAAGRGRGRGRGTGAPRKPRITKADRERMDHEKVERERQAAAIQMEAKPLAQQQQFLTPQNV